MKVIRGWCKALWEIIIIVLMFRMLGGVLLYCIQRFKTLRNYVGSRHIAPPIDKFRRCSSR
jgi:hypothetical protein